MAFSPPSLPGGRAEPIPVSAQVDTAGLRAVGAQRADGGRSSNDRCENHQHQFGFLASHGRHCALCWLFDTSGGEGKKVEKDRKEIKKAFVGVIINSAFWGLDTYVINKLLEARRGDGGWVGGSGTCRGGFLGSGGAGTTAFQLRSITPSGSVPLRNIEVRVLFSRDVDGTTAAANVQVLQGSAPVDGRIIVDGGLVTFIPSAACPSPYGDRRCFAADTDFTVRVSLGLRSITGQGIVCGGFAPMCTGTFRTGNLVDVTGPGAAITSPFDGQSVSVEDLVPIRTRATDDTGVSVIETLEGTRRIGRDAPASTSTVTTYDGLVYWDTHGVATGTRHTLLSRVFDIDSNVSTSTPVTVMARAVHCFDGRRSADETGLDCGGSDCGACSGGACAVDLDCAGGVCRTGICIEQPIITAFSPADGRVGTFVSIVGVNFGLSPGRVLVQCPRSSPARQLERHGPNAGCC